VVNEVWNISADTKAQFLLNNKSLLLAKTHKMLTQIVHINYIYTYLELGNRKKKTKHQEKPIAQIENENAIKIVFNCCGNEITFALLVLI
jgi:hypothetical protein